MKTSDDTYVLVDWGFPSGSPYRFFVAPIKDGIHYKEMLSKGTREEMEALLKLMNASDG